jgi:uncharacterized membrane protein YdbT with pleckstrin-like domain
MGAIIGLGIGVLIEVSTPWSDIVMQQINTALANPSISGDPLLVCMLTIIGLVAAFLFLPAVGAFGGFTLGGSA